MGAGLVHYHFASLQALLTEAAVGLMREVAGSVGPLLDRADTPADALSLLVPGRVHWPRPGGDGLLLHRALAPTFAPAR